MLDERVNLAYLLGWRILIFQRTKESACYAFSFTVCTTPQRSETAYLKHNELLLFAVVLLVVSQQTQNICITFIQRWTNVFDVGPTL